MLDKFRETAITWDKASRKVYESLRVSAGDNKGRKLSVQVVNGGVIEDLSGASLSLFWETKDKAHKGLDAFSAVDATKGEFEIYYTTGMLSNEGTLNANLVLVDANGRIVSEPFTITVFKGIDDDAIQSSDSFTALTTALAQVSNINGKADKTELQALKSTTEQSLLSVDQKLAETSGRIDTLLALPDGATTNDARLEDIKVGADGVVYETPAKAVREQVTKLSGSLSDINHGLTGEDLLWKNKIIIGQISNMEKNDGSYSYGTSHKNSRVALDLNYRLFYPSGTKIVLPYKDTDNNIQVYVSSKNSSGVYSYKAWTQRELTLDVTGEHVLMFRRKTAGAEDLTPVSNVKGFLKGTSIITPNVGKLDVLTEKTNALEMGMNEVSAGSIPSYYRDHVKSAIDRYTTYRSNVTNGDSFVFITDMHLFTNTLNSGKLIRELGMGSDIKKVFCGGDFPESYGTPEDCRRSAFEALNSFRPFKELMDLYTVRGNHDFTNRTGAGINTGYTAPESFTNFILNGNVDSKAIFPSADKMYYYMDNARQKIRYVFVNTSDFQEPDTSKPMGVAIMTRDSQLQWLSDVLKTVQEGWSVFVVGHVPILPAMDSYHANMVHLANVLKAYRNKTATTFNATGSTAYTANFQTAKGELIGYLCGHSHKDESAMEDGLLAISTTSDAHYSDGGWARIKGTTSEQAFDIVTINKDARKIKTIRVGAGQDREFSY